MECSGLLLVDNKKDTHDADDKIPITVTSFDG